jgi:hypothetical protein
MPSTQETPFPALIPPSPDTSASRPSVCNTCAQPFSNSSRLKRHQKQHLKPVTCPVSSCTHRTAEKRDMKRHVSVRHPGHISVTRYFCPETGCKYAREGFKRLDHLGRHKSRKHKKVVP